MNKLLICIFVVSSFFFASCKEKQINLKRDSIAVDAKVTTVKIKNNPNGSKTIFVYGDLKIESTTKKLDFYNLNCIQLKTETATSSNIYADSIASVLIEKYSANNKGKIIAAVYWVFPFSEDFKASNIDALNLKLDIKDLDQCK